MRPGDRLLGKYLVEQQVGEGAFGRVYLTRDESLRRLVAVKQLRTRFLGSPEAVASFVQEARAAANCGHPNIVTVYDLQPFNAPKYIIMEFLPGGTLRRVLRERQRLEVAETIRIACGICSGLSAIHGMGILHRDLKPENILFSAAGDPKISDFGLACLSRPRGKGDREDRKEIKGTLAYMSPEQVSGQTVGQASDLYALGVILHEMLTGTLYFDLDQCRTVEDVLRAIREQQPSTPSFRVPGIPSECDSIVMKLLSKRPDERYEDAGKLLADLTRLAAKAKGDGPDDGSGRDLVSRVVDEALARNWAEAFRLLRECLNRKDPPATARNLLDCAYCPRQRQYIPEPSFTRSPSDYARFWRGCCPKCGTQLELHI